MTVFQKKPYLLYSYLATEMLAPFFASFVIMNVIFFLVKLIPFLDIVLELNISFADFIRSFSYLFPNMLLYSIPMASMMGVIIGFTRLSNDTEILAFKACGIGLYHVIPPVVLVSLFISLITAYFSISLIPAGETAMKQLMYQLTKEKIDAGIEERQFTTALGDLVVYVEEVNKKDNSWQNVWVSDMRGQVVPSITMAQTGKMIADINKMLVTIVLNNGSLHRTSDEESHIVTFDKYVINIPLTPPSDKNTSLGIASMTMDQLKKNAQEVGLNTKHGKKLMIHYHKRLVLPFGCLIMSLMALPLGLQAGPGKKATGIPLGLGFFIIYYVFFTLGKTLAEETTLPVGLSMWIPNLFFSILTVISIIRVANEKPLFPESVSEIFLQFKERTSALMQIMVQFGKRFFSKREVLTKDATTSQSNTVQGNVKSMIYHLPWCDFYDCANCTALFTNAEEAEQAGYSPCRFCGQGEESTGENVTP